MRIGEVRGRRRPTRTVVDDVQLAHRLMHRPRAVPVPRRNPCRAGSDVELTVVVSNSDPSRDHAHHFVVVVSRSAQRAGSALSDADIDPVISPLPQPLCGCLGWLHRGKIGREDVLRVHVAIVADVGGWGTLRLSDDSPRYDLDFDIAGVAQWLEFQPSKLAMRVRFPSPAPSEAPAQLGFLRSGGSSDPESHRSRLYPRPYDTALCISFCCAFFVFFAGLAGEVERRGVVVVELAVTVCSHIFGTNPRPGAELC